MSGVYTLLGLDINYCSQTPPTRRGCGEIWLIPWTSLKTVFSKIGLVVLNYMQKAINVI